MDGKFFGGRLSHRVRGQKVGSYFRVTDIAKELRRQERESDFTGYTENFTLSELRQFLQAVGGPRWELSLVPVSWIKCWHTLAQLREIYRGVAPDAERLRLEKQVKRLANRIRQRRDLPGIFLVRSQHDQNAHWILDGHRRLLAHRAAKVPTILVYHPFGMFGWTETTTRSLMSAT